MSTVVKDLGAVTAYADAVAAGYTGTKEEWQTLMASYASVAEEAQEAREGAEAAQDAAEDARDAAISAKTGAESAVSGFGTVVTQATNQAVQTVRAEGTTQVGNVSSEGTTQVAAVQAKGTEVIQSIPADYTQLSSDVTQLKEDLSEYGAVNICPVKKGTQYPSTLTIVADGNGNYTVSGTNASYVLYDIYDKQDAMPSGISAGDDIFVVMDYGTASTINLYIAYYSTSNTWTRLYISNEPSMISIPQDAVGFRIRLYINASTYNNAVVKPYIFTGKPKFEYDAEIEKINTDLDTISDTIDGLKGYMPHGYSPVDITTTRGLVSRWNETATPAGWYYGKIPVTSGEKYSVSGNFYGGNYPAYLILNGNNVLSYFNPTTTGAFYGLEITIPENATHLVVNGDDAVSPVSISKYGLVPSGATSYDSILVGKTDDYEYTDINTAVQHNIGSIISVDFGTYETEIQNLATNKTIVGKDGDLCILTGTDKDYDHPPIEIAGGIVKNFTVTMTNAESASHKGYCLHSDNAACSNNSLLVENCKFNCIGQHSVGMGIYPNEEVIFKNCRFENLGLEGAMPIYMHNSGASDGVAVVRFHNCYFTGQKYAMQLQGWGSNANIKFEFIDCTCTSVTYGTADDCIWTDYVSGSTHDTSRMHEFSGKFTLLPTSHGNNISVLNA